MSDEETMSAEEALGWAEFCAWAALVMTPVIWWLQGPSVSTDQFVVRTALVVLSGATGVALRIRALIARRRLSSRERASSTPAAAGAADSDETA